jgi:hypothetical protein
VLMLVDGGMPKKAIFSISMTNRANRAMPGRLFRDSASLCSLDHGVTRRPTLRSTSLYYDVVVSSGSLMSLAEAK